MKNMLLNLIKELVDNFKLVKQQLTVQWTPIKEDSLSVILVILLTL